MSLKGSAAVEGAGTEGTWLLALIYLKISPATRKFMNSKTKFIF
jgi:hypothetical protein